MTIAAPNTRIFTLLLVEDSPSDVMMLRESLNDPGPPVNLEVVEDGAAAMAFVRREGIYAASQRPDLVLLDLNLPKKDGREVLGEIKVDERLKQIPIIIFSSSKAPDDISTAYRLLANCYIVKPIDFAHFIGVVDVIRSFWFRSATLPPEDIR